MTATMESIQREISWRKDLFSEFGGQIINRGIEPTLLRDWGIYGGQQGIWIDKQRTAPLTENGYGLAMGLLHKGDLYPDDFDNTGVIYHYPFTNRPQSRDMGEITAVKNLQIYDVPIFVIKVSDVDKSKRDVCFGYVVSWDDNAGAFIIEFGFERIIRTVSEEPFQLIDQDRRSLRQSNERLGQASFRIKVFQRYGFQCAVCEMQIIDLVDAAHIIPKAEHGTDDPRNGLPLCAIHHRAFDKGHFAIHPVTTSLVYKSGAVDMQRLSITRSSLIHLNNQPHPEALQLAWELWHRHSR
jgi:putative restriction endonuclease